ncbi:MAG: chromosome segregation protein SMC [Acidobacteriaceae bacterium]|nr:chromosome segregation protein SMC [Acidobacteriaceae bacterium]
MLKLKRVEIHGFKSFYDRTEMKFNGSGIAAIVGPNGCGKSNLSDAISWVLGEQSAKSLRGARMEDVIFAGTREKKALGMASVTMTLVPDEAALAAAHLPLPKPHESELRAPVNGAGTPTVDHSVNGHPPVNSDPPGETGHQVLNGTGEHAVPKAEAVRTAVKTGEITITRRLYRSGESEYLINGKTVRLRDIQDLFLGTGLGPESYAIIEQGRIGQILSNKPQDRRAVIEEAAGITKFKTRKRLAEAKLESAKQNLSRVFDILEEVTRQVNSLKRQAAKTKRYGELKTESTGYLRQLLAARFRMLERETAKLAIELNLASSELQTAQAAIAERETEQTKLLESSYATEQELTRTRKLLADLSVEAERVRGKLEYQLKQIQQIEQRLASGEQEAQSLEKQRQERAAELEQQSVEVEALDSEYAAVRQELETKAAERQQAQNRLAEQERGLEAARQRVLKLLGESSGLKNRITQIEAQLASADRETARAKAEEQQSESDLERIQQLKGQLSERLAARQTELVSVQDQRKTVEEELRTARAQLNESRHTVDRLRGEVSRVKARKDSLNEVIQHRSYTTETVKGLFTAVERGKIQDFRPVGVLADFLEVDPQFEKAAEEFLHDELEFVVVKDWADAERGVELMRSQLNGRATFVPEEIGEQSGSPLDLPRPPADSGITKLTEVLRFTNGLSQVPVQLLQRIASCYFVQDRGRAREMATQFPHCWFLTTDGVNYHGRAVSGGKKSGAGPLALKRELREVSQSEQVKQAELTAAQNHLGELEHTIASLTEHLELLRTQQQAQEKDVLALDHESRKLAEEFQRVQTRLSHARLELDRISHDRVRLQENVERDRQALAEREQARTTEEESLEASREQLSGLQAEVAHAAEGHASLRANLASLEERRRALAANRSRLENQVRDFANRTAHLARETERLSGERAQFLASNTELESRSNELKGQIAATEADVKRLADEETDLRNRLAEADEVLKSLRTKAQAGQEQRSELQVAMARAEADLKYLEETCLKELESTLAQLAETVETIPDDAALEELDAKYTEVRRKIEALGPVNPQALEEFEEAQQRQDFLNAQRQDLLDSIRDTERAIQELDGESRKRFGEAFHAINANFREMFKVLFGGGIGEMRLTDEENLAESGIDIVASPPGKRLQSVLLLSGGEKSLTAMALLMGIFQYTPSPFCILDEVDAPLDEPNIERLTRLLREMASDTQFIVITHSKRTMEAAQSLYGVTMQEPGVSKLVSVKFKPPVAEARPEPRRFEASEEELVTVGG